MMKNTIGFFLLAGLLGLSFAKPMPQEAKEMKDETTAMPMPVSTYYITYVCYSEL